MLRQLNDSNSHLQPTSTVVQKMVAGSALAISLFLPEDGEPIMTSCCDQFISNEGHQDGGHVDYSQQSRLQTEYLAIEKRLWPYMSLIGYHGPLGADIMTDSEGKQLVIDLNTRVTGSHSLGFLKGYSSVSRCFNDAAVCFPSFNNLSLSRFRDILRVQLRQRSVTTMTVAAEDQERLGMDCAEDKDICHARSLNRVPVEKLGMVSSSTAKSQGPPETPTTIEPDRHDNAIEDEHEGLDAWMQALGAFLIYTATWGLLSAYGSYEKYYETAMLASTPSTTIAWVGTLQGVILIMGGVVTGPIFDRGYFRELLIIGTIVTVLGVMMLSLAHHYHQVLLAQGVCIGIGSAILYVPSISLVASRFQRRRALAVFFATSGTAVGGIIYPIIFTNLQPKIGFSWTTRVLGFVTLAELVGALAIMLPAARCKASHKVRSLLDPTAFRDSAFTVFCLALFLMWVAYWVPFFLLPLYAQFKTGASSELSFYVLVICNASTIPGRYLAVPVSNRFGPALTMAGFALASGILLFGWVGVNTIASTIVWAVLIALFMGPLSVIYPILVPRLSPNKELVGTRMGISSAAAALGTLVGFPVTSALNDIEAGIFWKSQVFSGCCMLSGAVLMVFTLTLEMELLAAIIGVADVTARASTGLWKLCEQWRDAPKDVHLLRDDLVQANAFFVQIQKGISMEQARGVDASSWPPACIHELKRLLHEGQTLVLGVQKMVDELLLKRDLAASEPLQQSLITTDLQTMLQTVDEKIIQAVDKVARKNRDHFDTALGASKDKVIDQVVSQVVDRLSNLQSTRHEVFQRGLVGDPKQPRSDLTHHINSPQSGSLEPLNPGPTSTIMDKSLRVDGRMIVVRSDIGSSSEEERLATHPPSKSLIEDQPQGWCQLPKSKCRPFPLEKADPWAALLHQSAAKARFINTGCEYDCICQCHTIRDYRNWRSIFGYVIRRDLGGLRWALQTKRVCVHDVTGAPGQRRDHIALNWAIKSGDVSIAKFLIDAGSDVAVGLDCVSPVSEALSLFSEGAPEGKQILDMLPVDEFFESHGYSDLHKIVLGFLPLNMRESLQKPHFLVQVNQSTIDGQTPLSWAAARGDATAIRTLIEAGAEVDSQTSFGRTPLFNACHSGNLAAVQAIVDGGAAIDHRDKRLRTCLHLAAHSKADSSATMSFLIRRGAKVNARDRTGSEPLACAVLADRPRSVSLLLQQGADYGSARILLDYGADYTNVNNYGWGILHALAAHGDTRMIQLFTGARMRGVDATMPNLDGKTAIELFEERWDHASADLRMQFEDLLASLGDQRPTAEFKDKDNDMIDESSDGDFYDASDTWLA
ncbi:hypothetical protein FDECE_6754 [Fusarium decemcellulare]|nr:hypothetical protein FDECE_6754 [Fusarium decemcellulare]